MGKIENWRNLDKIKKLTKWTKLDKIKNEQNYKNNCKTRLQAKVVPSKHDVKHKQVHQKLLEF